MSPTTFDQDVHFYRNDAFAQVIDDAVRFFNGTPVHVIPPPERFAGAGVYALYYIGLHPLYKRYGELNKVAYNFPIYVGKAVPRGWRQARSRASDTTGSSELVGRLREHGRTIGSAPDLALSDFRCRFMVFDELGSAMISTLEAKLINEFQPLWNTVLDGFGNHTPGAGRFEQAKSDWDVIHPGRSWAERCRGNAKEKSTIVKRVELFLKNIKP